MTLGKDWRGIVVKEKSKFKVFMQNFWKNMRECTLNLHNYQRNTASPSLSSTKC